MATTPDPLDPIRSNIAQNVSDVNSQLLVSTDLSKELAKALGDSSSVTRNIFENTTDVKRQLSDTLDLASKLGTEYLKSEQITKRLLQTQTSITKIESDMKNVMSKRIDQVRAISAVENAIKTNQTASLTSEQVRVYLLFQQKKGLIENEKLLNKVLNNLEAGNKQFREMTVKATALSKIFASMSSIPFLKDFMDFKLLSEEFQKGFGAGMKNLGAQIKDIFKSPLFVFVSIIAAMAALIKAALQFDKIVTSISNNLGFSKIATQSILNSFRETALEGAKFSKSLDSALLSITNQAEALTSMQSTLQTNSLFTREMVENQILMTKQLGLSEEEAAGINKLSLLTGRSSEQILQNALKQNTTAISYRKIFSEIAKINSELSVAYKNNPELIAKAVIEANKLGMSLEQTQKIAKGLLDFETSISGELEAELLLGKQFNFEKARSLALDGKSAEAASELLKQIGGINALTDMNVIQRDRLAASISLSAEELTNAAKEQAVLNSLGYQNRAALEEQYALLKANNDQIGLARLQEEARKKEGGELLLQDIAKLSLNQRFEESMNRLKEIISTIVAGPIGNMLEAFSRMVANGDAIKGIFNAIKAAAIVAAVAFAAINPAGALAAAAIIGGGMLAYSATPESSIKDGLISPSAGNRILTPGGVVNTDRNDYIMASTNPGGLNNDAVLSKMDELINVMKKGGDVFVDTVRSGTAYGMSATKYA